eukprot:gene4468-4715_t
MFVPKLFQMIHGPPRCPGRQRTPMHSIGMLGGRTGLLSLVVAVVAIALMFPFKVYQLYVLLVDAPEPCPRPELADGLSQPSCFFSQNYYQARALFRQSAELAKADELHALPVDEDEGLFIDVAVFKGSAESLVLHISGTHGTEGYAGSAIQSAWLHTRRTAGAGSPTVIMVHALNPFGMANWRRWNEVGIDLNRNCMLTTQEWDEVLARDPDIVGYDSVVDKLANRKEAPTTTTRLALLFHLVKILATGQMGAMKRAGVAATYTKDKGIFYGGRSLAASHVALTAFLKTEQAHLLDSVRKLTVIDVHSGLGPLGKDTLLVDSTDSLTAAQGLFGGGSPPAYGFQNTNEMPLRVLSAHVFATPTASASQASARLPYSRGIYEAFSPVRQSFYSGVMSRGLEVLRQALAA